MCGWRACNILCDNVASNYVGMKSENSQIYSCFITTDTIHEPSLIGKEKWFNWMNIFLRSIVQSNMKFHWSAFCLLFASWLNKTCYLMLYLLTYANIQNILYFIVIVIEFSFSLSFYFSRKAEKLQFRCEFQFRFLSLVSLWNLCSF